MAIARHPARVFPRQFRRGLSCWLLLSGLILAAPVRAHLLTECCTDGDLFEPGTDVYYQVSSVPDDTAQTGARPDQALPGPVAAMLVPLRGSAYPSRELFLHALDARFAGSGIDYRPYQETILARARVIPGDSLDTVEFQGSGCGCLRHLDGLVYGFYPYWLAAGQDVQSIDFDLYARINLYRYRLTQDGTLRVPLFLRDDRTVSGFIGAAHRQHTGVDLTIHMEGWADWDAETLERAVDAAAGLLVRTFSDRTGHTLSDLLIGSVASAPPYRDGVALSFSAFADPLANRAVILQFTQRLARRLADSGVDLAINLMLDADVNQSWAADLLADLSPLLLADDGLPLVDYLLLPLREPVGVSKQRLRAIIEQRFDGVRRAQVLRKTVPVISPHLHSGGPPGSFARMKDDLVYFQDNFAGVALWPLPKGSDPEAGRVRHEIHELYERDSGTVCDADEYPSAICEAACIGSTLFRVAVNLLAGLVALYALYLLWVYGGRRRAAARGRDR